MLCTLFVSPRIAVPYVVEDFISYFLIPSSDYHRYIDKDKAIADAVIHGAPEDPPTNVLAVTSPVSAVR